MSLATALKEQLSKHEAAHPKKAPSKKTVHRFEVEPAEGGYMLNTHYKDAGHEYTPPAKSIHKSIGSVAKHMKDACGEV